MNVQLLILMSMVVAAPWSHRRMNNKGNNSGMVGIGWLLCHTVIVKSVVCSKWLQGWN
jgi:hypothetical protein